MKKALGFPNTYRVIFQRYVRAFLFTNDLNTTVHAA